MSYCIISESKLDAHSEQLEIHSRKIKQLEDDKLNMKTRIDELTNIGQLSNEQKHQKESLLQKVQSIERELEQLRERLAQLQQHGNSATMEEKRDGKSNCSIITFPVRKLVI